ncbi:MAG: long-chain-fatty-acid--CoA ligase [Acidobacteria bacterium]|nr:long-chain-fatty-acid--CoA ligase [Acidobacteriota bacterium]
MKLPLTPLRFLARTRRQFASRVGVIDGNSVWTYAEYAERCCRLAALLRSWNLRTSGRVAFLSYNSHSLLEAYYGVPLAGGILLPLNIRLAPADFAFILNDAGAEILFFHPDFLPVIEQIRGELKDVRKFVLQEPAAHPSWVEHLTYEELLNQQERGSDLVWEDIDEDSVAELFYTSGTTASPKGVMLTHRNLYLHALQMVSLLRVTDQDVQLHTISLFHVNGWGTPQYLTAAGGCHVLLKKFEPQQVFELIQQHRVTMFSMVPTMATSLLHFPARGRFDTSSLRHVMLGGAASNSQLIRDLEDLFKCECFASYGLTETTPVLTAARMKSQLAPACDRHEVQSRTGYPVLGVELTIFDADDQELPWDGNSVGEIVVRADIVMAGYWNRPEETLQTLRGGWLHTGDLATIDPDGYVTIVDRKKDMIVSGGENISSLEVEKALLTHPAVLECAVVPVPDPVWGETPQAVVVLKPTSKVSEADLVSHCRRILAGFKIPRNVEFVESLPKSGTGKVLKRELREKYWSGEIRRVH